MDFGETLDRYHIFVQDSTGLSFNICFILKKGCVRTTYLLSCNLNVMQDWQDMRTKDNYPRF